MNCIKKLTETVHWEQFLRKTDANRRVSISLNVLKKYIPNKPATLNDKVPT